MPKYSHGQFSLNVDGVDLGLLEMDAAAERGIHDIPVGFSFEMQLEDEPAAALSKWMYLLMLGAWLPSGPPN